MIVKQNPLIAVCILLGITGLAWLSAQGPLTPPGAPAPTMKTLDEIEPRTTISQADLPRTISMPGSYVVTENLSGAGLNSMITVAANDVTIDLRGFVLDGAGSADSAIDVSGVREGLTIANGTVRDCADAAIATSSGTHMLIRDVKAFDSLVGIIAGAHSLVLDCQTSNNNETGIDLRDGSRASNCIAKGNDIGIDARNGAVIEDCVLDSNSLGIRLNQGCFARNNHCLSSTGTGLRAKGSDNRIVGNRILNGTVRGLELQASGSSVSGNIVHGNADNYVFAPGNDLNLLLCEVPETIDWPASVTFAGSLSCPSGQDGILVNDPNVTIDLDGHCLSGEAGALVGITVFGSNEVSIKNGSIKGFQIGVKGGDKLEGGILTFQNGGELRNLAISDCSATGAEIFSHVRVTNCQFRDCGVGLSGNNLTVSHCGAWNNSGSGISVGQSVVIQCETERNGLGISAGNGSIVSDCKSDTNSGLGISVNTGSSVINCSASKNTGSGIRALKACLVRGNSCDGNGAGPSVGAGIFAEGDDNRIEGNHVTGNDLGIDVDGTENVIIRNTAIDNGTNYDFVAGNTFGTIFDNTGDGSGGGQTPAVSGNSATSTIGTTHPWANFAW